MAGSIAHPLVVSGIGSLISVPFLVMISFLFKGRPLALSQLWNEVRSPFLKVLITRCILGQSLIVAGFTMTTAVKAVLLLRLEPLFVFLWSLLLLGEKPRAEKILLLVVLLVGSVLVVIPGGAVPALSTGATLPSFSPGPALPASSVNAAGPNLGDGLVVLSLLFLSYSYLPTQQVVAKANPAALNLLGNLIGGAAILLVAACALGPPALAVSLPALALIFAYSIVFFVIACFLYFYAFTHLRAWIISSFLSLEVVFGLFLAFAMLNESISFIQLIGAMIVLGATFGIARLKTEPTVPELVNP